jgi:DNA-binding transcriptional LysR family regulator
LNLQNLRVFREVVERQGVTAAAVQLYMTQPAVTAHVRALEQDYASTLLERRGRGVTPTEAGMRVYDFACRTLESEDELRHILGGLNSGRSGTVVLVTWRGLASETAVPLIAAFKNAYPDASTVLRVADQGAVEQAILRREADVGLTIRIQGVRTELDQLRLKKLRDEPVVLIAPASGRYSLPGARVEPAVLRGFPFVTGAPGAIGQRELDSFRHQLGIPDAVDVLAAGSAEGIVAAVREGLGVSVVYRCMAAREIAAGEVAEVDLGGEPLSSALILISPAGGITGRVGRAFWDFAGERLGAPAY